MTAPDLYKRYTTSELVDMAERIRADPESQNPAGSLYIYTPKARKKLEAIAMAITYHLQDKKDGKG